MKRMSYVIVALVLAGHWETAFTAPPPGHPSVDKTTDMLNLPRDQASYTHTGRVVEAINSNNYTYILVETEQTKRWLAAPKTALQPGQKIRFPDGALMRNFYSKSLKRTFQNILFVSGVTVALEET
jgi:hypothetical protein